MLDYRLYLLFTLFDTRLRAYLSLHRDSSCFRCLGPELPKTEVLVTSTTPKPNSSPYQGISNTLFPLLLDCFTPSL